jgi:serine/threonine-protein kinase
LIGTSLDKYEVLQKVGEGGMATVYRGRHATLDRDVAIKVLHPHLSSSVRNRKRFAREAKAIEHLRHANILEIFDYSGIDASDCYIVTEFVHGETLTHLLQRRGRVVSEVTSLIGIALCRALAYAHAEGVLHRDIKTDNVMLRVDGTIKLMDFGIARFLDETHVTMTGALVGSPAFMSPEQAREEELDNRSDLFALGTVLFYLVTGHLPFAGSNPSLILKNVIEGNRPAVAELAPSMSARLAETIERLMATDPADRFVSATDVEQELIAGLVEVGLDSEDREWSLVRFVADPDGYEQRLDAHLRTVLLSEGQKRLAAGDHLGALRLFNRLLSMDEHNADVLRLIRSLHGEVRDGSSPNRWLAVGALGVLAVTGLVLGIAAAREPRGTPDTHAAVVGAAVESPRPSSTEVAAIPPPAATPVRTETLTRPIQTPPNEVTEGGSANVRRARSLSERPPPPPPMGRIKIITGRTAPLEIWEGGTLVGKTKEELTLPVGAHDLVLKHEYYRETRAQVTVSEGEATKTYVPVEPKPAVVQFGGNVPDDCVLSVNGTPHGLVGTLPGRRWTELQPDKTEKATLSLQCPDAEPVEWTWEAARGPSQSFPYTLPAP